MKYQVIARKFRPQVFQEVVGQSPIVQTLRNAIQLDRIGHAYLFSGPRGVGKTTTARILAKGLNCHVDGPTPSPCGDCPSCSEIAAAQSIDVLEIDAASNTGVDNIRELRESARYVPARDRYKIFIIDEVHMLSTSAFNALLKILEEPPPHVVFIVATTERHKLPATILSRCQQFVFRTISVPEIHAHLRQIVEREGVAVDDRALSYIVKASEGSMRDAQSLLDQIISFSGSAVGNDDVRDVLGFIPSDLLDRTVAALTARDSRDLLETVALVVDQGLNLQQYIRELVGRVRDMLLMKLSMEDNVLASPAEKQSIARQAEQFSEQDLVRCFDMLLRLEIDVRASSQPRFQLEIGLVKLARIGHVRDIEEVLNEFRQGGSPSPALAPRLSPGGMPANPAPRPPDPGPTPPGSATLRSSPATHARPDPPKAPAVESSSFSDVFRKRVAEKSPVTAVHLERRADRVQRTADTVEVLIQNGDGLKLLDTNEHRSVLNDVATELIGKAVTVSLIMKQTTPAQDVRSDPGTAHSPGEEPLVQRFLEAFRGDIAQVKPPKGE